MTNSRKKPPQSYTEKARRDRGSKKGISITGSWDLNIPLDLLYEILSYLGLKDNIIASTVCKTWLEVAVSVRNLEPRPLLFYPQRGSSDDKNYVLLDPSRSATYNLNFQDLKGLRFSCSRDGWLLVWGKCPSDLIFFLNPFTRERFYLPKGSCYSKDDYCLAFSAAPTSTSCMVISLSYTILFHKGITYSVINTWKLGKSVWTTHHLEHPLPCHHRKRYFWDTCSFSNGIFYCLSPSGLIGVLDPSKETWNILQVRPAFPVSLSKMLMTEHKGDIFVIYTRWGNKSVVFKLNLLHKVWEEKREVGALAVFKSYHASLTRAAHLKMERNRIYP